MDVNQDTGQSNAQGEQAGNGGASTYGHIAKYTGFFGIVQVLSMLVGVVRNKLAAVLLGKAGVGLSSLYLNVTGFVHTATNLGVPFSSIKEISARYGTGRMEDVVRQVEVARTWGVWTGVCGMLLCMLLSPAISWMAFGDLSHILPVCILAPSVCCMAVSAVELSVLKAVRRLKRTALAGVFSAVVTLLFTIPFYLVFGVEGIVPALLCSSLGVMVVHLCLSIPVFAWRVNLCSKPHFRAGWPLVRVGVPYILAGMVNMAVGLGLSLFIARVGSLSDVGLYSMGYNLVFTYAGVVFSAVDTEFFPRLSAICDDRAQMNLAINRQAKVSVLLISPILVLFMLAMPLAVRLLYSPAFLSMTGMAVCASVHLFFKSLTLPVAYTSLAKGDALTYFCMEVVYDVFLALSVGLGYYHWGVFGTGVALALAGVFDWWMIRFVYSRRYGFRSDGSSRRYVVFQFVWVMASLALALWGSFWAKIWLGGLLLVVSCWCSYAVLRRDAALVSGLFHKFGSRLPFGRK